MPQRRTARSESLSIRCTERLSVADAVAAVGSRGDSCGSVPAELVSGLCETELIRGRGRWTESDGVACATLKWVDWLNHRRLLEPIGSIPPTEVQPAGARSPSRRSP